MSVSDWPPRGRKEKKVGEGEVGGRRGPRKVDCVWHGVDRRRPYTTPENEVLLHFDFMD